MTNVKKYREFCKIEDTIPIFSRDWWLDLVCGEDNWDVIICENGGKIVASMPFYTKRKSIFTTITMPKLTQTMGIYIKYPKKQKYYKKLSWEKKLTIEIINKIPNIDSFSQNFHHTIINWLPFYWNGFNQTIRYTYIIQDISIFELEKKFETDIRRRRKKSKNAGVEVYESNDIEKFYEVNEKTFKRKGKKIPYSFSFIEKLYNTCKKNNACKVYLAKDIEGNIIAGSFLLYDNSRVYYLMGGIDPNYKDLGGMDIILYESIKFALENGKIFDFEGSMIESIEKYFRSFGAVQQPYFNISKTNSKLLITRSFIKDLFK